MAVQSTVSMSQRGTRAPAEKVHLFFFIAAPRRTRTNREQIPHVEQAPRFGLSYPQGW
jgi:hypothetical protein